MLVFIVYYYGFILRAGLEQVDLSAVYTLAVVLISSYACTIGVYAVRLHTVATVHAVFFPTFLHTLNYMHLCVLCSCLAVFEQPEVDYFPIVTLPNGCDSSYITYFPDNYNILLINDQHFFICL